MERLLVFAASFRGKETSACAAKSFATTFRFSWFLAISGEMSELVAVVAASLGQQFVLRRPGFGVLMMRYAIASVVLAMLQLFPDGGAAAVPR
jgi:hypothetical protein